MKRSEKQKKALPNIKRNFAGNTCYAVRRKPWDLPEVDPIEMIKIRMEDFGYKPSDLAKAYGDKGTISKVLNYKQLLSLNMIRIFSKMLRIPTDALTKEYQLKNV